MAKPRRMADDLKREVRALTTRQLRLTARLVALADTLAVLEPYLDRDPEMTVEVGRALLARSRATLH